MKTVSGVNLVGDKVVWCKGCLVQKLFGVRGFCCKSVFFWKRFLVQIASAVKVFCVKGCWFKLPLL